MGTRGENGSTAGRRRRPEVICGYQLNTNSSRWLTLVGLPIRFSGAVFGRRSQLIIWWSWVNFRGSGPESEVLVFSSDRSPVWAVYRIIHLRARVAERRAILFKEVRALQSERDLFERVGRVVLVWVGGICLLGSPSLLSGSSVVIGRALVRFCSFFLSLCLGPLSAG